jgi:hypothetical protein
LRQVRRAVRPPLSIHLQLRRIEKQVSKIEALRTTLGHWNHNKDVVG